MRDYTKILAWQKADDLTVAVYEASKPFPKAELYALTSQVRRAAYSVAANIVEGAARESKKDYLHFLIIGRGSLAETRVYRRQPHFYRTSMQFQHQPQHPHRRPLSTGRGYCGL